MTDKLTDELLRNMASWLPHHVEQQMATELLASRARVAELEAALGRSDGAIQKAAMSLGSTDEWADQEAMIADFEARIIALARPAESWATNPRFPRNG